MKEDGIQSTFQCVPQARAAEESLQWYRQEAQQELEAELKEMEAAVAAAGEQRVRDTAAKLLRPANLRPLVTVLALFLLYPLTGVYNISFFAVSLFTRLGLGGAETVAVFTALVRCGGTLASTLLLLRSGYSNTSSSLNISNVNEILKNFDQYLETDLC